MAEGRRGHIVDQWLLVEYFEETTQLIANAALSQVQQHGNQMRQRECSLAGEIRGVIAGRSSVFRFVSNQTLGKYSLISIDIATFFLAGNLANTAHWSYLGGSPEEYFLIWTAPNAELRLSLFAALITIGIGWFWLLGHYTLRRPFWDEIAEVVRVLTVLAVVDAALLYLAKIQFPRFWFVGSWAVALALIPVSRLILKKTLSKLGIWQRPAIIFGTGNNALEAVEALQSEPSMGFDIVAFIQPERAEGVRQSHIENAGRRYPVMSSPNGQAENLRCFENQTIIVALDQKELLREERTIARLHRYCSDVRVVLTLRGLPLSGATVHHLFRHELFFLTLRNNLARRAPRILKRAFDLVFSALLLIALSPLFMYLALRIRGDGGPIFFYHTRIGLNAKPFQCIKFRTMAPDAPSALKRMLDTDSSAKAEWQKVFKLKNDPRITKVGKVLREYSLDELPQLWNVLKGDMSLVGPRPIVVEELSRYGDNAVFYLETSPGMTGLWQISGRNDTDYNDRVYLDSWYVKNWSFWYDIVILLKTMRVVFARGGAY